MKIYNCNSGPMGLHSVKNTSRKGPTNDCFPERYVDFSTDESILWPQDACPWCSLLTQIQNPLYFTGNRIKNSAPKQTDLCSSPHLIPLHLGVCVCECVCVCVYVSVFGVTAFNAPSPLPALPQVSLSSLLGLRSFFLISTEMSSDHFRDWQCALGPPD